MQTFALDLHNTFSLPKAVCQKKYYWIEKFLTEGADPNELDSDTKLPAIFAAIENEDTKAIEMLLNASASLVFQNNQGATPLILAAKTNKIDIVKLLLKEDTANIDQADDAGNTAIMYASSNLNIEMVDLLLEQSASISIANSTGDTVLTQAMSCCLLINSDTNHELFWEKKGSMIRKLCSVKPELLDDFNPKTGNNPLTQSIKSTLRSNAKLLISEGANVNVVDQLGLTPLDYAINNKLFDVVESLLKNGAKVKSDDNILIKILSFVGYEKVDVTKFELVELALKQGASPDVPHQSSRLTPLMIAATLGEEEVVKLLINNGVDINAKTIRGTTALIQAAAFGKEGILKLLINNDADMNAKTYTGRTALSSAKMRGYKNCYDILRGNQLLDKADDQSYKSPKKRPREECEDNLDQSQKRVRHGNF